jgi:hypothetical protein
MYALKIYLLMAVLSNKVSNIHLFMKIIKSWFSRESSILCNKLAKIADFVRQIG